MSKILIVAHAGSMGTDDDSLESVKKGIELEADVIELDIRFDSSNVPILSHDKPSSGKKCETVYDAALLINDAPNIQINADMKEKESIEGLVALKEIFERFNFKDRMYFSGINRCESELLQKTFPGYKFFTDWNINIFKRSSDAYLESIVDKAKGMGFTGFNLHYRFVTKKMVDFFHQRDMKIYTWTVEKEADMKRLARWGVDSITTRNPPLLQKVLNERCD